MTRATDAQLIALDASVREVADGAADPWEVAHLVGLVVRIVPARRAHTRLVGGVVLVPALDEHARGSLVLEGVAVAALRAAGLDEDETAIAELASMVARRIGWRSAPIARAA